MKRRDKIIYWIATGWLALGMLSTGIVQLIRMEEEVASLARLGYPAYLLTMLGVAKLLGVGVILAPRLPILKEWAYAGFAFVMAGALVSHWAVGDGIETFFGPTLLLILTLVSWRFRPDGRRVACGRIGG